MSSNQNYNWIERRRGDLTQAWLPVNTVRRCDCGAAVVVGRNEMHSARCSTCRAKRVELILDMRNE